MDNAEHSPHRIRLIGPWELERRDGSVRVHLPRDWAEVTGDGTTELRLSRRFHRPTRLDSSTQIFIVMPDAWNVRALTLNGRPIESGSQTGQLQRFDITSVVQSQEAHELEIVVRNGGTAPFLVAIEIDSTARSQTAG
jgi:hypothetical protein